MIIRELERLILRDFCKKDIKKRLYWELEDIEWQDWDAPWEKKNCQMKMDL